MIVVLDTNVVVSGILKPFGPAGTILRLAILGVIRLGHDARILFEYREVLSRPVFGFPKDQVNALIDHLEKEGLGTIGLPLPFRLPDPDDEPFLEIAIAGRADVLVTGNKKHFPRKKHRIKVMSPAEFVAEFRFRTNLKDRG
jgi:putative PIN family toxin of toxin-antitoxin system